jgi:hypothetical protein
VPVGVERHDPERGRTDRSEGTNAHRILSFLAEHPEPGFTPREIHERTDVPRGSVGTTLSRVERHGLVRHRGESWAVEVTDQDDWYTSTPDWADDLPNLDAE